MTDNKKVGINQEGKVDDLELDIKFECPPVRTKRHVFSLNVSRRRMKIARDIACLTRSEASTALGYANTAIISKIESVQTINRKLLSLDLIVNASCVYGVSADYLLGISDYPERDPETVEQLAVYTAIRHNLNDASKALMLHVIGKTQEQLHSARTRELINQGIAVFNLFDRLYELNNESFDQHMRGGAKLLQKVNEARRLFETADQAIKKAKHIAQARRKSFTAVLDESEELGANE
ncbi:hypothetical protein GCM10009007_19010 [Formosimonas limnophila]|uniref:Uncharacterized protein n=1 Tax=Formosimonas limnophila TaxID=1384487 RepID=A0A8J3CNZ7_9BURK|nr:hypothetical protein [Formosimonas limnophila]GHA78218.1 hypothetical protein GCM10009007_19010 [Formosimonas limnophila]